MLMCIGWSCQCIAGLHFVGCSCSEISIECLFPPLYSPPPTPHPLLDSFWLGISFSLMLARINNRLSEWNIYQLMRWVAYMDGVVPVDLSKWRNNNYNGKELWMVVVCFTNANRIILASKQALGDWMKILKLLENKYLWNEEVQSRIGYGQD